MPLIPLCTQVMLEEMDINIYLKRFTLHVNQKHHATAFLSSVVILYGSPDVETIKVAHVLSFIKTLIVFTSRHGIRKSAADVATHSWQTC